MQQAAAFDDLQLFHRMETLRAMLLAHAIELLEMRNYTQPSSPSSESAKKEPTSVDARSLVLSGRESIYSNCPQTLGYVLKSLTPTEMGHIRFHPSMGGFMISSPSRQVLAFLQAEYRVQEPVCTPHRTLRGSPLT